MKSEDKILDLISLRFPNHKQLLTELFNESESFKSLCQDYYDCRVVLDESIKNSSKSNDMLREYQILLKEIEDELLEKISL